MGFIPFLDYDVEIRKGLCWTNAIESLDARYRRAVRVGQAPRPCKEDAFSPDCRVNNDYQWQLIGGRRWCVPVWLVLRNRAR